MHVDFKTKLRRIAPHQLVDAIRGDCMLKPSGAVVAGRAKQRTIVVSAMSSGVEVIVDKHVGVRMQRQISRLVAFARHAEMRHALPRMPEVLHFQLAQLVAPQGVEKQRGQDGSIALALDRVRLRRRQQLACLVIAERLRLAFTAFRPRPLDAFDRIMGDGVLLAQILEQRGERGEPVPDRAAAKPAVRERARR